MRFLSFSYVRSYGFHDPASWLSRIQPYVSVMEALARKHEVFCLEQINYKGELKKNGVQYYFVRPPYSKFPLSIHWQIKKLQPDVVIVHGLDFPLQVVQLRKQIGKQTK